jgi:hypothetical protein
VNLEHKISEGTSFADDQCPMQPIYGDRVSGLELPAREWALHELEAMRDPVDAIENRGFVTSHSAVTFVPSSSLRVL